MTTLTPAQLRSLPFDVVVGQLVPMLASTESKEEQINRWTMQMCDWTSTYSHTKVADLPGYVAMGQAFLEGRATVNSSKLEAFFVFGAKEKMPYTVFAHLFGQCVRPAYAQVVDHYSTCMYWRKVQRGELSFSEPPTTVGASIVDDGVGNMSLDGPRPIRTQNFHATQAGILTTGGPIRTPNVLLDDGGGGRNVVSISGTITAAS